MYTPSPFFVFLNAFALAVWAFAFWRGGAAERWGAAVVSGNQIAFLVFAFAVQWTGVARINLFAQLFLDGAAAIALLLVLLRFGRPWLGLIMLLYAAQFTLQSVYFVGEIKKNNLHILVNNLNFIAIHVTLAVGTAQYWLHVRRAKLAAR